MGVVNYGQSSDSLSSLPAWAQSVSAALDGSDITVNARISAAVPTTWTAYTCTYAGTGTVLGTGGTQTGRYVNLNGKTILVRGVITLGTSPTMGATQTVLMPMAANLTIGPQTLQVTLWNGSSYYQGIGVISSNASLMSIYALGTNGAQSGITSSVPFTWASGSRIVFQGTYEAA